KAIAGIEVTVEESAASENLRRAVTLDSAIKAQCVFAKAAVVQVWIVQREVAELKEAAVIKECPLLQRHVGIDAQPRVAANLFELPVEAIDETLAWCLRLRKED